MSVNEKMTAIADAIRDKTGDTAAMTLDAMATAIAGIQVSAGSEAVVGMETGSLTTNAGNYYGFSIPVTSKKSHVVVWPKDTTKMIRTDVTGRFMFLYAVAGDTHIQANLPQTNAGETQRLGSSRWYNTDASNLGRTVFNDTSIDITIGHHLWASGSYLWCAW